MTSLALRVHGEYREMPGLRLTVHQAARLFSVTPDVAGAVLHELRRASILRRTDNGAFSLIGESFRQTTAVAGANGTRPETNHMNGQVCVGAVVKGSLNDASVDRLACLLRHWTWANEAMATFDRELANGWDYDDDPMSDRPFGAYYHWCALLCALSEAALEHGLLSPLQLDPIRNDLETCLPGLRACRQCLVIIPGSLEEQPRIVDLMRDRETLSRLRRVHEAFGELLRKERLRREIDSLDQ